MAICNPAPTMAPEPRATPISPRSSHIALFRPSRILLLHVTLLLMAHIVYISLHPPSSSLDSPLDKRSNLIDKFGDKINEWLPQRRLKLIYKASVYVPLNHNKNLKSAKYTIYLIVMQRWIFSWSLPWALWQQRLYAHSYSIKQRLSIWWIRFTLLGWQCISKPRRNVHLHPHQSL